MVRLPLNLLLPSVPDFLFWAKGGGVGVVVFFLGPCVWVCWLGWFLGWFVLVWASASCFFLVAVGVNQTLCSSIFALLLFTFSDKRKSPAKEGVCYCNIGCSYFLLSNCC